ncbi:TIMELESS-interacting protein [Tanacetum coccineum]|uniref:TIMELESS-interacting protein n=1 Tax=Tanacetum coccineum TaxID=301880 RepID=A0ABQ5JD09_9ASTR
MESNAGAAPTGCYKCGRPGHWSRDCPSNPNPNPNPNSSNNDQFSNKPAATSHPFKPSGGPQKQIEKPKKVPKTRPKLTAELLLSDDGLGFVLKHFPKALKCRGRGHEAQARISMNKVTFRFLHLTIKNSVDSYYGMNDAIRVCALLMSS